jgi:hypothetical protein
MKINFLTYNANINSGSYRIWVRDLSTSMNELGIDSTIKKSIKDIDANTNVIILCKSCYKDCDVVKSLFPESIIGAINIDSNFHSDNIDFVIVGSPEEYISISQYNKVFIYPLIERSFENLTLKEHTADKKLKLCFHGHYPHLFKFEPFLRNAIEVLAKEMEIELKVISDHTFDWKVGKPNNIKIDYYLYDLNTISDIIKSCDVGVVPNVSDIRLFEKKIGSITSVDCGLYATDYFLRYKNKTNAGRAYVFYQHGIPVIHDLSPSNFDFMGRTGEYICAHDTESWIREFKKLTDHNIRNKVAKINNEVFKRDFNPVNHARSLIKFIKQELA